MVAAMKVSEILLAQDGVISRSQVLEAGERDQDIRRRLARREWSRIHPGVFVNHNGPPTWNQLAWAAVLFYWPAALEGPSALHAFNVRGHQPRDHAPIHVCVDRTRTVRRRLGIVVYQLARAESLCKMDLSPPRQTVEHALLSVAARKKRLDASVATLADAVQCGRTTVDRLRTALGERPKLRHRGVLGEVLRDVDDGVRSALEFRYMRFVERAHGLPRGERQEPLVLGGKRGYPDVHYEEQNILVHLDGRIGHTDSLDKWADFDRDLDGLVDSALLSVHVGWGQVLDPCRLARLLGALLQQRGWNGSVQPCSTVCTAFEFAGDEFGVQTS
jgi:hypothetical protein